MGTLPPPPLPSNFVPREDVVAELKKHVLQSSGSVWTVRGEGGLGKTVSTSSLFHHHKSELETRFPDGCHWLTLGEELPAPVSLQAKLALALEPATKLLRDEGHGKAQLAAVLCKRNALIVLDDCWTPAHANLFITLPQVTSGGTVILITTRTTGLLQDKGVKEYLLGSLSDGEASELLQGWPQEAAAPALELCGRLPLAVSMVAGISGSPSEVLTALRAAKSQNPVDRAIEASTATCSPADRESYTALAVFPEDAWVPVQTLATYLRADESEIEAFVQRMLERGLVQCQETASGQTSIRLHDLQLAFLRQRVIAENQSGQLVLVAMHARVLNAYQTQCQGEWWKMPNDGYAFQWLLHHLVLARGQEGKKQAIELLANFDWLDAKLRATNEPVLLLADFHTAALDAPTSTPLGRQFATMRKAVELSAHVLGRDPAQLAFQLAGRLPLDSPALASINKALAAGTTPVLADKLMALQPKQGLLAGTEGALRQVLAAHDDWVRCLDIAVNGKYIISGSNDFTVKVWTLMDGSVSNNLLGHASPIRGVCFLNNDTWAASCDEDGLLYTWDLQASACLHQVPVKTSEEMDASALATIALGLTEIAVACGHGIVIVDAKSGKRKSELLGHEAHIDALATDSKRTILISGAQDGAVIVWRRSNNNWTVQHKLIGCTDEVRCVAISADGGLVMAGCDDYDIRIWRLSVAQAKASSSASTAVKSKTSGVTSVTKKATSSAGTRGVSTAPKSKMASKDATAPTGTTSFEIEPVAVLKGHTDWIHSVSMSADGTIAVSGADDDCMMVWDMTNRACVAKLPTFSGCFACKISTKGDLAVSASLDIRRWDVAQATVASKDSREGHAKPVCGLALSEDGALCISVSQDMNMIMWDTTTGTTRWCGLGRRDSVADEVPKCCDLARDASSAVVGTDEGYVLIFSTLDCGPQLVHAIAAHEDSVRGVALTDDSLWIASVSEDSRLVLIDAKQGTVAHSVECDGGFTCVALGGNGACAAPERVETTVCALVGGWGVNHLMMFTLDLESPGRAECSALGERLDSVGMGRTSAVSITPDGRRGVVTSSNEPGDPQVWIWDLLHRCLLHKIGGVSEWVTRGFGCTISACGKLALSCTWDRKVQVWCCESGQSSAVFQLDRSPTTIAATPRWTATSSATVCIGDDDGKVHMLRYFAGPA